MRHEKLIYKVFAGLAFLLSFLTYLRTIAPTTSFWDCGEFITCSYILGIPHPPGAPFYLLLGRIFTLLPLAADIGLRVNLISALSSAFTVFFLYLIIIKLIKQWRGEPKNGYDLFVLIGSGFIGALSFAFTDSFWFNAVEAEVYGISMLFTASVIYLILLWLEKSDSPGSERYLLLLAYLLGLAIAVHLLMILALPAIAMVIYFKYLESHGRPITLKRFASYIGYCLLVLLLVLFFGLSVGIPFLINLVLAGIILIITAFVRPDHQDRAGYRNFTWFLIATAGAFGIIYPGVVQFVPRIAGALDSFGYIFLLLLVVGIVLGIYYAVGARKKILSLALMSILLVIAGYSTYTMIYIRSNLNPAVDENDPETLKGMVSYLNREQYGTWGTLPRRFPGIPPDWQFEYENSNQNYETYQFGKQIKFMWDYQLNKLYWRYFGWQFIGKGTTMGADGFIAEILSLKGLWGLPFLLGLLGMIHHFFKHWKHASVISALFVLTGVAIVIYLNQEDPQPRERDYVFVGSFFAFAIWLGMGVTFVLEWLEQEFSQKRRWRTALSVVASALIIVLVPINLFAYNFHTHDRQGEYIAFDYSYNILQSCEPDAIVFTNGDNDTFPLWFLQYVYKIRQDVRVVNLSLLNTPWYIKQLKNQDPKVPISLTDDQIEKLEIIPWKKRKFELPVPAQVSQQALRDGEEFYQLENIRALKDTSLSIVVEPTVFGQAIRVQDYMVLNIVASNQWQKPVYFAVTVSDQNKVNMDEYLRMDGLTFKLVPYHAEDKVAEQKLEKNLSEIFQYRNLDNPKVYLNDNVIGLLQNYRAAFLRLAHQYLMEKNNEGVVRILKKMEQVVPFDVIPAPDIRLPLQVGQYYQFAGRIDEFLRLAEFTYQTDPENPEVVGIYVSLLQHHKRYQDAIAVLSEWQIDHPADSEAQNKILELQRQVSAPDSVIQ